MNDFTKDELIKLKNGLDHLPNSVNISHEYWSECEEIISKLQSLIDNYCKHEWREGMCQTCIKCNSLQEY